MQLEQRQINHDRLAHQLYQSGQYHEALDMLKSCTQEQIDDSNTWLRIYAFLAHAQFTLNQYSDACETYQKIIERFPLRADMRTNLGITYGRLKKFTQAREELEFVLKLGNYESIHLFDELAYTCMCLNDFDSARQYGQKALMMKDQYACKKFDFTQWQLSARQPPNFSYDPKRNVIAFSLYGDNPKYLNTALRNVELCPVIYPGWSCRFYLDDTVPQIFYDSLQKIVQQFSKNGYSNAQVTLTKMPRPKGHLIEGRFWRFLIANDPNIDYFLVRDADALINIKERIAVDDWLSSKKCFHVMRDFSSHTELILAGLWGGVAGVLPDISQMLKKFTTDSPLNMDQIFLRECIWPLIKTDVKCHDRHYYGVLDGEPYLSFGNLPPHQHVGMEWSVGTSHS